MTPRARPGARARASARRIQLVHGNAEEARRRAQALVRGGYRVSCDALTPATLQWLKRTPPAAVVIDLSRAPARGRDLGLWLRTQATTRRVPLVFVGGGPDTVRRARELLPDAAYTTWGRVRGTVRAAVTHPPHDPVVPRSVFAGYARTPLIAKLGITPRSVVALINAPPEFDRTLGELPAGVTIRRVARGRPDLIIWFTKTKKDLDRRIARMATLVGRGGLWIVWPKKASELTSDLAQPTVRAVGMAVGLVDYKVCAIDAVWTGLRFSRRKRR